MNILRGGCVWLMFCIAGLARAADLSLDTLKLPPGFQIELYAQVPNARQMALGKTHLFVGSMRAGKVYAVPLTGPRM